MAERIDNLMAGRPRSYASPLTNFFLSMALERLQKFLARMGLASRREAEEWIRAGRVRVNDQVVTEMGVKVDPLLDVVMVDSRRVRPVAPLMTVMLHKPSGYVSSSSDPQGRRVVTELVPQELGRLYPVGRLDYDATGLMLLSSDGELAHRLMHPSYQVPRIYRVSVSGEVAPETLLLLARGVEVQGRAVPIEVQVLKRAEGKTVLELTVREGRYHLVKRLLAKVGHTVLKLKRLAFGTLQLGSLPRGSYRRLTAAELAALKAGVGLK
jgi:23S rRNA pseudouridine2605 synthase